jgi:predicted Zn-dependent protease
MEKDQQPEIKNQQRKSKAYFIIGYIFLLIMAFLWSVDSSLISIFFGAGVFFIFLGFHTRVPKKVSRHHFNYRTQSAKQHSSSASPLFGKLKNIVDINPQKTAGTRTAQSNVHTSRSIVKLISISVFAMFFIFFLVGIFNEDNGEDAVIYYQRAEQNYWSQNYDSAYLNYRKAWRLNPEYAEAILGYGNVLEIRNDPDSALIMIDKALEIDPSYKEASYSKAFTYYNQKKYDQSIAVLRPVLEANPDYYDATLLMGDCYYLQKKYDEAILLYEEAYTNGGSRSRVLCHIMAYIYDTKGDYEKAITLYKEALSYDSSVVDIYKRLGELIPNVDGNVYRSKAALLQQR